MTIDKNGAHTGAGFQSGGWAMGLIIWIAVGLAAAGLIRALVWITDRRGWQPSLGMPMLGALLGGFATDLLVRGDSVMHFKGPTVAGALVGTILVLAISFYVARHDQARTGDA